MKRHAAFAALVVAFPLAAAAEPATDAGDDSSEAPAELPDIEGVWAQKLVTPTVTDVPVVGEVISQTITFQRIEVAQSNAKLELTEETCSVDIESNQNTVRTVVPDRFVEHIETIEREAELRRRDDGVYLYAPKATKFFGVELDDSDAELPDDPNDPRVIDQDRDGNPGMTVEVEGLMSGELYLVQRSWDALWGKFVDDDRLGGRVEWNTDQVVVERSGRVFGEISESNPHPDPEQSYFRMRRVDESTDCDDIADKGDALF